MLRIAALLTLLATSMSAAGLSVENEYGGVEVTVSAESTLAFEGRTSGDFDAESDLTITRDGSQFAVRVMPREAPLDIIVRLPLGFSLRASTTAGDISVEGMIHRVRLDTDTGAIRLKVPLRGTRLTLDAGELPVGYENRHRRNFRMSKVDLGPGKILWRLRDRMKEEAITYGAYRVRARAPRRIEIEPFEPPSDWPLRFPWEAQPALTRLLQPEPTGTADVQEATATPGAEGGVVFRSDVRMVNLSLSVSDAAGLPISQLAAGDFRVLESGVEQRLAAVQAGDSAFNLAVLLDMSGSTAPDLVHMKGAARRFVEMARPGDRVAIYALSQGMFQVVTPLSSDRTALLAAIDNLPPIAGASPLYDIVTLAYVQELHARQGERNALIVISDGLDNQVTKQEAPSAIKLRDLTRAAEEMHAIIYPVFLLSGERFGRNWSKKALDRISLLALASGGRVFPAESISDLEPVFPLIEAELRSVYTLGYYPEDQNFDGTWRAVEVQVDRPDAAVRARPGYYAN